MEQKKDSKELVQGTLLQGGRYRIVRFIASGGFGCTYEAEHTLLGKRLAIKECFPRDFCNRDAKTSYVTVGTDSKKGLVDKLKRKFIGEAKALACLSHPGIVSVTDVFEENGTAYFVMDYVDGRSLGDMVKRDGPLSESRALGYLRQVCDALEYVHSHNRLHLDIKPGNITVDSHGHAVLIDFGASKQYDEESGENTSTLMGKTPGYAPLEQMSNAVVQFTPATDIYALGATLYKLLTGNTPPDASLIALGDYELAPLPKSVSAQTTQAVNAALQLNKKQRPQSISEFRSLLPDSTMENEDTVVVMDVVKPAPNLINGHEYVDLGLPSGLKWATCNVGASAPEEYGDYFAWGETKPKDSYDDENCPTYDKDSSWLRQNGYIDSSYNLTMLHDAARQNWGGSWRMPTKEDIEELVDNTTMEWIAYQGVYGRLVKSKRNGNSIFLPAAGWRLGTSLYNVGEYGSFWSSTPGESSGYNAYYLYFYSGYFSRDWSPRYYGPSVRPVSE